MRAAVLAIALAGALLAAAPRAKAPAATGPGGTFLPDAGQVAWHWRDVPFDAIRLVESRATSEGIVLTVEVGTDFFHSQASPVLIEKFRRLHPERLELRQGECVSKARLCFLREAYSFGGKSTVFRTPGGAEEAHWGVATGGDFPEVPANVPGAGPLFDPRAR